MWPLPILAFVHVAAVLCAPHLGRAGGRIKQLGFWIGGIAVALRVWQTLPHPLLTFRPEDVVASVLLGNLSALIAFCCADFSLRRGAERLMRSYRFILRPGAKAFGWMVLLAAYEEIIWRDIVQASVSPMVVAWIVTGVWFGLAHLPPTKKFRWPVHLDLFALSMLCSVAASYSGTVLAAIVVHGIRNWACHTVRYEADSAYREVCRRHFMGARSS
jgi:membrane protease YdiL (CAAX protease family)